MEVHRKALEARKVMADRKNCWVSMRQRQKGRKRRMKEDRKSYSVWMADHRK